MESKNKMCKPTELKLWKIFSRRVWKIWKTTIPPLDQRTHMHDTNTTTYANECYFDAHSQIFRSAKDYFNSSDDALGLKRARY